MPISYSEYIDLACPSCGARFEADVWTLIDAAERSDLAQALRDGALNMATCPKCGAQTAASAALLLHDPAGRRVYFAVPPNVGEHVWRERAQELLYQLVGSLPEDERRPYLGDVQVEHELDGVRRALLRHDRRRGVRDKETGDRRQRHGEAARRRDGETGESRVTRSPAHPLTLSPAPSADESLIDAVRALLAADTETEFSAIVADNPALLNESADAVVRDLAELAYADGDPAVSAALHELRIALARLRMGDQRPTTNDQRPTTNAPTPQSSILSPQSSALSDSAYQALAHAASPEALLAATRDYPALLEPWADADLAARIEAALDEGNERLARAIEARREGLAALRAQLSAGETLRQAVQALLAAEGEDALAGLLSAYPILMTETAQEALSGMAADALARDDEQLAEQATACQTLLRTVRVGLEER